MKAALLACLTLAATVFAQSPATTPTPAIPVPAAQPQSGFTMVNGLLYEYRNGVLQPVTGDLVLRISPNGTVTGFDGRVYSIPAGVILSIDARVAPTSSVPALTALPVPIPAATPAPTVNRTTIYTAPPIDAVSFGSTTVVPVPTTVVVPGTITIPAFPTATPYPASRGAVSGTVTTRPGTWPTTNNPFSGAAPAAMGVNTTATGNQQNTLGTQQIRPGMGNAVGTGGGPARR